MLMKLFKYEFKTIYKKLIPFYGLILIMPLIWSLFGFIDNNASITTAILLMISFFIYFTSMFVAFFVTFFSLIQRYNKSVYGNEGYLTNTLPVKPWELLISKSFSIYFWCGITAIISFLSVLLMIGSPEKNILRFMLSSLKEVFRSMGFFDYTTLLSSIIVGPFLYIFIVFFCIGVGNQFNKKFLMGIIAFIVISLITTSLKSLIFPELKSRVIESIVSYRPGYNSIFLKNLTFNTVLTIIFFFSNKYMLEKRLNLN